MKIAPEQKITQSAGLTASTEGTFMRALKGVRKYFIKAIYFHVQVETVGDNEAV
ncbi:hypothetical protein NUKP23_43670 [Klebsiella variicola]|nr:hypothetical protein NUKP23_43670 [Klebsiella variicola]